MAKFKVKGMGSAGKGHITFPKVAGKGGLKIEGGFKAGGTDKKSMKKG